MSATMFHKPTNALKTSPIEATAPDHNAADRIDAAVFDASKLLHRTLLAWCDLHHYDNKMSPPPRDTAHNAFLWVTSEKTCPRAVAWTIGCRTRSKLNADFSEMFDPPPLHIEETRGHGHGKARPGLTYQLEWCGASRHTVNFELPFTWAIPKSSWTACGWHYMSFCAVAWK